MKQVLLSLALVAGLAACDKPFGPATAHAAQARQQIVVQGEPPANCDLHCDTHGPEADAPTAAPQQVDVGEAPSRGPTNAPVTVVEFSDFQCPFCARATETIRALEQQYPNGVRVAFKQLPLPFHKNARLAATAALAAGEQRKFWEFHDLLFAHQEALDRASLESYAQSLGLDMERFKAALDDGRFDATLEADHGQATRLGAMGTPTFFINGRKVVGAQPLETFKAVVDDELAKAR